MAKRENPPVSDNHVHASTWGIKAGSLQYPLIVAHRGDLRSALENTMPAFRNALEAWADAIQLDVRLTRDGQLVVVHDWSLERTGNGNGPMNHYTLKELQSLDVGSWLGPASQGEHSPTLDEVFESLHQAYLLNVIQAHWYDPAHDSYNPNLHHRFHGQGRRMLAWDVDFGNDLELMAYTRLDAVVTDNLAALVQQKKELLPAAS